MMRSVSFVIVSLFLVSCGIIKAIKNAPPPPVLTAPDANAPISQRIEAYESLHPVGRIDLYTVNTQTHQIHRQLTSGITLANGTDIYAPEFLAGVILPNSSTAIATKKSNDLRQKARPWMRAGLISFVAAVPVYLTGALVMAVNEDLGIKMVIVGGAATVAAIPLVIYGGIKQRRSNKARDLAFASYDESLLQYLNLCKREDGEAQDCSLPTALPTALPSSAPASVPSSLPFRFGF